MGDKVTHVVTQSQWDKNFDDVRELRCFMLSFCELVLCMQC